MLLLYIERLMKRSVLLLSTILGTAMCQSASADDHAAWRLFVADQAAPIVKAIDPKDGKLIETFETTAPASLNLSESGRTIFAVQGSANHVQVISTGIVRGDHGDHDDLKVESP